MFDHSAIKKFCKENNLTILTGSVEAGDTYVAMRNTGPVLLQCKEVVDRTKDSGGYIIPDEPGQYFFDSFECVRVRIN